MPSLILKTKKKLEGGHTNHKCFHGSGPRPRNVEEGERPHSVKKGQDPVDNARPANIQGNSLV